MACATDAGASSDSERCGAASSGSERCGAASQAARMVSAAALKTKIDRDMEPPARSTRSRRNHAQKPLRRRGARQDARDAEVQVAQHPRGDEAQLPPGWRELGSELGLIRPPPPQLHAKIDVKS